MQTVRFLSSWGYRSAGDVVMLPQRETVHLRDRGIVEYVAATETTGARHASGALSRRSADMSPASLDEKARTIEAIIATEMPVERSDYIHGAYLEVLSCKPADVDLRRLNAGASFLDSHNRDCMERVLGAVVPGSAKAVGKGIVARIKFASSEDGEQAWQMAREGTLRSLSIGYLVYSRDIDDSTNPATHRITMWQPYEVSAVPIPADTAAGFL